MKQHKVTPFTPVMDKDVEVSTNGAVLRIEIHCGSAYEAAVLQDDFKERLDAGRHIVIAMQKIDHQ